MIPPVQASARRADAGRGEHCNGFRSTLVRRTRFLILDLHLIYDLLHIWNTGCNFLRLVSPDLGVDVPSERNDAVFHAEIYVMFQMVLNQSRVHVALDTIIDVRVHILGVALRARRLDGDLIGNDLADGQGLCDRFSLLLVGVRSYVSAESDDAFVAILAYGNVLVAGLIERLANF